MGADALSGNGDGLAAHGKSRASFAWPSRIEALLVIAAVVAIYPLFARVSVDEPGRDSRFADPALPVTGLPPPVLRAVCATHGDRADPQLRERLCASIAPSSDRVDSQRDSQRIPGVLRQAQERIAQPFALTEKSLDANEAGGPAPLACAFASVSGVVEGRPGSGESRAWANVVLLLAAAIDGHPSTALLAASAALPRTAIEAQPGCESLTLPRALARASTLMADARASAVQQSKNEAMRALSATAGTQWAAWMLAGLVLLQLARTRLAPAIGVSLSLAVWSLAAWAGRVPWPFAADRAFEAARARVAWDSPPAKFVVVLLALAAAALVAHAAMRAVLRPSRPTRGVTEPAHSAREAMRRAPEQTLASRVGYPGFVVATGIGWVVLLDLSANGPPANRYLGLYHHGHLWLALVVLTTVAFVRPVIGRALAWLLAVVEEGSARVGRAIGSWVSGAAIAALVLAIVVTMGALLSSVRQLTSELGRVWLVVGAAWFFFLRGSPLAERIARSSGSLGSLVRYAWPIAFVAIVLVGTMLATRDMGPLLIASYAAGAFLAASIAMWWHVRLGGVRAPAFLAAFLFAAWIAGVTLAVFRFGAIHEVTAGRLENLAAPLASANDQLALVGWFRAAAPREGFGPGGVPWCGYAPSAACAGVPAQIQSDYTFTALAGTFGEPMAWALCLGGALWLHRVIRHHGRVTRGEPRLLQRSGRVVADHQAFLSWIGVAWVVLTLCQLAVTVAGNLAVLPLTGVTFPFVSFGMTSLVVNSALLALCLNVNVPQMNVPPRSLRALPPGGALSSSGRPFGTEPIDA